MSTNKHINNKHCECSWDHEPFLGETVVEEDGGEYVVGRGAIDDKQSLMGILQALEVMLGSGERPRRTLYIGLGHDEEVGGEAGAGHIATRLGPLLQHHGETLDFLLDEGMVVLQVMWHQLFWDSFPSGW